MIHFPTIHGQEGTGNAVHTISHDIGTFKTMETSEIRSVAHNHQQRQVCIIRQQHSPHTGRSETNTEGQLTPPPTCPHSIRDV